MLAKRVVPRVGGAIDLPTSLYALASHAAGDFPLQTDEMAAEKLDDPRVRARHVTVYTLTFVPVALLEGWSLRRALAFLAVIWLTHFGIDSRRWNDAVPIWYDQALHVIALAVAFALSGVVD